MPHPISVSVRLKAFLIQRSRHRVAWALVFLAASAICSAQLQAGTGEAVPAAALADSSAALDLAAHRGSVVYLDFWASWCGPCRQSFPWMNAMQTKYGDQGLVIIAVNLDRKRTAAKTFLAKIPANFEIAYDPDGRLAEEYELEAMPSSFLFGRDGTLHESHLGFRDSDGKHIEEQIQALLREDTNNDDTTTP